MLMKKENVVLMLASGARLSTLINYAMDMLYRPPRRTPALICRPRLDYLRISRVRPFEGHLRKENSIPKGTTSNSDIVLPPFARTYLVRAISTIQSRVQTHRPPSIAPPQLLLRPSADNTTATRASAHRSKNLPHDSRERARWKFPSPLLG